MSNISKPDSAFFLNASDVKKPYGCLEWPCGAREIDTAGWLFEKTEVKTNLTVLPSLAFIIFLILVFLKIYKWYKDNMKLKARGDVEFGDESEVNYGIIREGDKEFCKVEMRSDTTSVYDTVTSFRLFGNGQATCIAHDTVGSYKSLVLQRGDPSHYDSVKSYKAFLRQVTQNQDLDVEVKLLENYPMKCKSAEHCVVMEEDNGEWQISKARLLQGISKVSSASNDKKKNRYRRASGEPLGPMRKRSASNPTYNCRHPGATSLPSIHYSVSSDSSNDEDTLSAFKMERKKAFEDRCKKMSRSCSGGKLTKVSCSDKASEEEQELLNNPKRKRHYSADGGSRMGKLPIGYGNKAFKISRAFQHELNNLRESISETDPKPEEHILPVAPDESSSENPDSSPSPCDSSVSSDAIESESEDDETKLVTQISAVSDCTTVISNRELASSAEILSNHSANSDGFTCSDEVSLSSSLQVSHGNDLHSTELESKSTNGHTTDPSVLEPDTVSASPQNVIVAHDLEAPQDESTSIANNNVPFLAVKAVHKPSHHRNTSSPTVYSKLLAEKDDSEDTDNSVASNPRRVKRFHVTSVQKDDLASHQSS